MAGKGLRCCEAIARIREWARDRGLDFRHDTRSGFGAVFSRCGTWRYLLFRHGPPTGKLLGLGLLNPSRADETRDDPTIRQCRARARQAGLSGVVVWNLFAFRATLPADLRRAEEPVGPENDAAIALALGICESTILAWGNHGLHRGRDRAVLRLCADADAALSAFGVTARGQPRHLLYLAAEAVPSPWRFSDLPSKR